MLLVCWWYHGVLCVVLWVMATQNKTVQADPVGPKIITMMRTWIIDWSQLSPWGYTVGHYRMTQTHAIAGSLLNWQFHYHLHPLPLLYLLGQIWEKERRIEEKWEAPGRSLCKSWSSTPQSPVPSPPSSSSTHPIHSPGIVKSWPRSRQVTVGQYYFILFSQQKKK